MQALGQGLDLQIRRSCVNQAARLGSGLRSGQIKTHRSIAACYCAAAATKRGAGLTALRNRIRAKWGVLGEKIKLLEPSLDRDSPESGFGKTVCEWYRR